MADLGGKYLVLLLSMRGFYRIAHRSIPLSVPIQQISGSEYISHGASIAVGDGERRCEGTVVHERMATLVWRTLVFSCPFASMRLICPYTVGRQRNRSAGP